MSRSPLAAIPLVLISAGLLLTSIPTLADVPDHPRLDGPVTVRFGDLNAGSPADARVIYSRLRAAARKVCGHNVAPWYPGSRERSTACYEATLDSAVRQIDRPLVTALHGQRTQVAGR